MIEQNHNFEIETALMHFMSAFDQTVINRYSADWKDQNQSLTNRQITDKIKVNYVFGPKQRIVADLEGKTDTVKFPIVSICPTGFNRDDTRVKNKNINLEFQLDDGNYGNMRLVPWNISISMTIMSKFHEDITQIISNFAVQTNPYIIFSWREPKTGREVNAEVFWDGQINMEYPTGDLPPNSPFRIMATVNFVIKTYLYRTEINNTPKICQIKTDIIVPNKFYCNYEKLSETDNINVIDSYQILGKPQIRYVDNWYLKTGETPKINIQGDGFALTDNIYVSGSDLSMYPLTEYEHFGIKFKGYRIEEFEILDSQHLSFLLPEASALGFADIIITNECGVGKLTEDANRCNRVENPYPVNDPEHYNWCVLQFPYLNGIIISNNLNDKFQIDPNEEIIYYEEEHIDKEALLTQIRKLMELGNINKEEI